MKTREEIAIIYTTRAANEKDWRITNKRNRAAREAARELLKEGGYFIGTKAEAAKRWPDAITLTGYESEPEAKFMWAFGVDVSYSRGYCRHDINLIPVSEL